MPERRLGRPTNMLVLSCLLLRYARLINNYFLISYSRYSTGQSKATNSCCGSCGSCGHSFSLTGILFACASSCFRHWLTVFSFVSALYARSCSTFTSVFLCCWLINPRSVTLGGRAMGFQSSPALHAYLPDCRRLS